MEPALKHRLIGAAVLSALAIIFLPMLIVGKDPNDTASRVPLKVPASPAGDFETKELPLMAPASGVPDGGVVGMDTSHPASPTAASPAMPTTTDASGAAPAPPGSTAGDTASATSPSSPAAMPATGPSQATAIAPPAASGKTPAPANAVVPPASPATTAAPPLPAAASPAATPALQAGPIPAANAGGHYVVSLGTYSNAGNAAALVASLKAKQLPAYAETVAAAGKPATRVRIGPFQQRGDAEAARLRAQQVRSDMPASVTALDAAAPAPEVPAPASVPVAGPKTSVASPPTKPVATTTTIKPAIPAPVASGKTPAMTATALPAIDKPVSPAASGRGYAVQVSAFAAENQATALRDKLRAAGFVAYSEKVQAESGTRWRVRIGPEADHDAADHLRAELSTKMNLSGMVVSYP